MAIQIGVGIVHAKHIQERVRAMDRLRAQLTCQGLPIRWVEDRPGKFYEWSSRVWAETRREARAKGDTHLLYLNDDVILCADFAAVMQAAVEDQPSAPIVLHAPHYRFQEAVDAGKHWATSDDGFVGPAYLWPWDLQTDFLDFRAKHLKPGCWTKWPEDAQMATYCLATRRKIWHPMAAFIDIDEIKSCYGHDGDPYTRPWVRRTEQTPWLGGEPHHIGLCYEVYHWSIVSHLRPESRERFGTIGRAYELERTARNPRYLPGTVLPPQYTK